MSELDPRIAERVRGQTWADIRETVLDICDRVLAVGPGTRAQLTTIYVKFAASNEPSAPVYAVMWLKTARNVVVGFSLPNEFHDAALVTTPAGMNYKGITKYVHITFTDTVPSDISKWARLAFDTVLGTKGSDGN